MPKHKVTRSPNPTKDSGFLERIPAKTRLLGRVDLSRPLVRDKIWEGIDEGMGGAADETLEQCKIDKNTALARVDVAIGEPFQLLAEVQGTLTVDAIACVLGVNVLGGELTLGNFLITEIPKGLSITNYEKSFAIGAPQPIRHKFVSLTMEYPMAIVVSLGPRDERVELSFVQDESVSRFEVNLQDRLQAHSTHEWLVEALRTAATKGGHASELKTRLEEHTLIVEAPSTDAVWNDLRSTLSADVIQAFKMPSTSMAPTLVLGDHFYVAKGRLAGTADRGDVIVFSEPNTSTVRVSRVVGVGGDEVVVKSGELWLNGSRAAVSKIQASYQIEGVDPGTGELRLVTAALWSEELDNQKHQLLRLDSYGSSDGRWRVPHGHIFVLGDNRDNSRDSRSFGTIPKSDILGHVAVVWLSTSSRGIEWDRMGRSLQ